MPSGRRKRRRSLYTVRMEPLHDYQIAIDVETRYLEDQSKPAEDLYCFAYTIGIRNAGRLPAQLLARRWEVVDANGEVREVVGDGVVGEQPRILPGERFEYTSGACLKTPWGSMEGAYRMRGDDGTEFEAPIPRFALCVPRVLH